MSDTAKRLPTLGESAAHKGAAPPPRWIRGQGGRVLQIEGALGPALIKALHAVAQEIDGPGDQGEALRIAIGFPLQTDAPIWITRLSEPLLDALREVLTSAE